MPVSWPFADDIRLAGIGTNKIAREDAERQETTSRAILRDLTDQPGIILADEVGMGKTYVALAVVASVLRAERNSYRPVVAMVPPGLVRKWQREWEQFKEVCCSRPVALSWVHDKVVYTPTQFFGLLDDPKPRRPHLLWMSTGCFSMGLSDPWIKLALIRLARSRTKMNDETKKRLYKWAATLVRLKSNRGLTPETVERLLAADLTAWHRLLIQEQLLKEDADDPIPEHLLRHQKDLDWSVLAAVLRGEAVPGRQGAVSSRRLNKARWEFNDACQDVYWQWLATARWRAPLFVLDEAHHAKNDSTRLASLLRSEDTERLIAGGTGSSDDRPLLWDKFDRMLFLTATPFQLGHHELIRVLRSFAAANWSTRSAPRSTREEFLGAVGELEGRLDENRLSGRRLDRLWGRLTPDHLAKDGGLDDLGTAASLWWKRVSAAEARDPLENEIIRAVEACQQTKKRAENDTGRPWASLRTWVVRHNRATTIQSSVAGELIHRRRIRPGMAIAIDEDVIPFSDRGLSISEDSALPFLLAARAQGELAAGTAKTRAFFAEGLCSSYEAFHHTREGRGDVRDVDDDGVETATAASALDSRQRSLVPVQWYESHITALVPSNEASDEARGAHPKLRAVVDRVTRLWLAGEKVLVFCFYRQTARALRLHIGRAIEQAVLQAAGEKLGIDAHKRPKEVRDWLERIARRLGDDKSPFHAEIMRVLREPLALAEFEVLRDRADGLTALLAGYVRSPTFIARYLPLEMPEVRDALGHAESRTQVVHAGVEALRQSLVERADSSALTMTDRVIEFLRFAKDLAERARHRDDPEDGSSIDPLDEYINALGVYVSPRRHENDDDEEVQRGAGSGSYRVLPTVRMVFGATKHEVRERLMLAFNSPLFPEILISSAVLGEGVDLHRFCRHVIHHDLCWNPSTLEQRTGRVDRIRCKAEVSRRSIVIHEPYLAGSADEKMYRVVRDRERWFQIVMGQKFELDEASSEKLAQRVPLPESLATELIFDLRRAISPPAAGEEASSHARRTS